MKQILKSKRKIWLSGNKGRSSSKFLFLNLEVKKIELISGLGNQSTRVNTEAKTQRKGKNMHQGLSIKTACHDSCSYQKTGLL